MTRPAGRYRKTSDIRVGVIGYGGAFNMGRQHLSEMRDAGMTPAAVAEIDPKRLEVAEQDFPGIGRYTSVAQMLRKSDVDLVTIITPHNTHAKLAAQCLRAGRHVVCEKPFAITTAECDRMVRTAQRHKRVVSTYHNRHWDGCIRQALATVKRGRKIGDIVRIEAHMGQWRQPGDWWRSSKSISGGVLYDWGVHLLEYALQLIDAPIAEVSGFAHEGFWASKTAWKKDTTEDEGFLTVRFDGGPWLTVCITNIDAKPKEGCMEITGTKGTYVFWMRKWKLIQPRPGKEPVVTEGDNPPGEGWRFYRNVAAHLTKREPLVITPQWARRPIHVLDLACRSARAARALKARYQ